MPAESHSSRMIRVAVVRERDPSCSARGFMGRSSKP
jgi:hypothetical protein